MPDKVISVENVSKSYQLGSIGTGTLRGDFQRWWASLRGMPDPYLKIDEADRGNHQGEMIWALKDINFSVQQGEALGIIGRNGAGKSTLLKILSEVTAPTSGEVKIKGRIASLLEVGTGFHPELTGRENIYLNGTILGMRKTEIDRKFDEIVDFSGVDKFIDTPVKRFSSGMYVRLAFAVAAHLEPEILIVDEVLAVGDAEFQKKCLGKMGDVAHEGRTVLFVSHNMQAIRQLCNETIWINGGFLKERGATQNIVNKYLKASNIISSGGDINALIEKLPPDPVLKLEEISIHQEDQPVQQIVLNGKPLDFKIRYKVIQKTTGFRVYIDLLDEELNLLFRSFHDNDADGIPLTDQGTYVSQVSIPADMLAPKEYFVKISACIFNVRTILPLDGILIPISVQNSGNYNKAYASDTIRGKLAPVLQWKTIKE
jgi:lipopolysaccharide transport system ATP-binding protein